MLAYWDRIKPLSLSKLKPRWLRSLTNKTKEHKTHSYCSLAVTLIYLGKAALPQAYFVAPKMQQRIGCPEVLDLVAANDMVKELHDLTLLFTFVRSSKISDVNLISSLDSFHAEKREVYAQSGVLSGL